VERAGPCILVVLFNEVSQDEMPCFKLSRSLLGSAHEKYKQFSHTSQMV